MEKKKKKAAINLSAFVLYYLFTSVILILVEIGMNIAIYETDNITHPLYHNDSPIFKLILAVSCRQMSHGATDSFVIFSVYTKISKAMVLNVTEV